MKEPTDKDLQRACDLIKLEHVRAAPYDRAISAFAKYIAEQEAPKHPPELVERMESYIREYHNCYVSGPIRNRGRAILAELDALQPDPVNDEALKIAKEYEGFMVSPNAEARLERLEVMALAVLKRGMELERSK